MIMNSRRNNQVSMTKHQAFEDVDVIALPFLGYYFFM
jgi:hypothetical protein